MGIVSPVFGCCLAVCSLLLLVAMEENRKMKLKNGEAWWLSGGVLLMCLLEIKTDGFLGRAMFGQRREEERRTWVSLVGSS